MPLITFFIGVLFFCAGLWMMIVKSLVLRLIAIVPLLIGAGTMVKASTLFVIPSKWVSASMVLCFLAWGASIWAHKGIPARIIGVVVIVIAVLAGWSLLGTANTSIIETALNTTFAKIGQIFAWANSAFTSKG